MLCPRAPPVFEHAGKESEDVTLVVLLLVPNDMETETSVVNGDEARMDAGQ